MPLHVRSAHAARRRSALGALALLAASAACLVLPAAGAAAGADSFVTKNAKGELQLDGKRFRFAGTNLYYLGLDDNIRSADNGQPTYPTKFRIDDAFASAKAMNATVVRSHTLGISVGCPRCIEPSLGVFNPAAFDTIDYAIATARRNGVRLVIPLVDQWQWYHGGKHTFTTWRGYRDVGGNAGNNGAQAAVERNFYTDERVIGDFQQYVAYVLNHRNPYTGLLLKDDPTILAWESGNEIWDAPPAWTERMGAYVKDTLGARQLFADGTAAHGMTVERSAITAPHVDLMGGHFYPDGAMTAADVSWMQRDAAAARRNGKAYFVGEFDWSKAHATPAQLRSWLTAVENDTNIEGDLFWTLLPHMEDGTCEPHNDGFETCWPGTGTKAPFVTELAAHAARMRAGGTTPPSSTRAPSITGTAQVGSTLVAGAATWSYAGTDALAISRRWQSCNGGSCSDITGATGTSLALTAAVQGRTIRVVETARAAAGTGTSTSTATATVAAAPTTPPVGTTTVDDSAGAFTYGGSWLTSTGSVKSGGSDHYSSSTGATARLTFTGTKVVLVGAKASHHGIATVAVDGDAPVRVDAYSAMRVDQGTLFTSGTLASGAHTLVLTVTGTKATASTGTVFALDAAQVTAGGGTTPPPPTTTYINDATTGATAGTVQYAGTWNVGAGAGKHGGDDHYSDSAGATATIRFAGTKAVLRGALAAWHGRATVSIDGGTATTVDLYSATRTELGAYFTSPTLARGAHTITVRVTGTRGAASSGTVVTLDRVDVTA